MAYAENSRVKTDCWLWATKAYTLAYCILTLACFLQSVLIRKYRILVLCQKYLFILFIYYRFIDLDHQPPLLIAILLSVLRFITLLSSCYITSCSLHHVYVYDIHVLYISVS